MAIDIQEALKRPSDFGYRGDLPLGTTWSLGPVVRQRDSSILEESNYHVLMGLLKSRTDLEGMWEITGCSHWAVGWVDHLSYQVVDDNGQPTAMHRFVEEWFEDRDNYIVADDSDYSERLFMALREAIKVDLTCMSEVEITDDRLTEIAVWLGDEGYVLDEVYVRDEHLKEALLHFGMRLEE